MASTHSPSNIDNPQSSLDLIPQSTQPDTLQSSEPDDVQSTEQGTPQLRVLHTSDWHLGQHFFGNSRDEEHAAFIDWLLGQVEEHQVDVLIIAGDIFDTGTPPSYARTRYSQFVAAMQNTGCQLVVLGGNHDSVATLHESRELLACLNASVTASVTEDPQDQILTLKNRNGDVGGILCAIPFLRQRDLVKSRAGDSSQDKQQQLMKAMSDHYVDLFQLAEKKAEQQVKQQGHLLPILATGHMTCVGGQLSESVRELYIGTLDAFPAGLFPKADYIALGHLHRPQKVANSEHIRYSGSPIPLSFDESSAAKQVLLVDFNDGELTQVTPLEIPLFRRLKSLQCTLDELPKLLESIAEQGEKDPLVPWLEVMIDADQYISDLQKQIQQHTDVLRLEILRVRRKRTQQERSLQQSNKETLAELEISDVFEACLEQSELSETLEEEQLLTLTGLFNQVVDSIQSPSEDEQKTDEKEVAANKAQSDTKLQENNA